MTTEVLELFNKLKWLFAYAPMLVYYNLSCWITLEYNTSKFAIEAVLSQLVGQTGQ